MNNLQRAKEEARGIMAEYGSNKMSYMMKDMDEFIEKIVTSTYLQAVWEMGVWIEEQDFARKVAEKTGNAEAVYEVQDVIKKIQTKLQSLNKLKTSV